MTGSNYSPATRILKKGKALAKRVRRYQLSLDTPRPGFEVREIGAENYRIGTQQSNDWALSDQAVSRLHFEIQADEHGHRMRDLGSTNGTYVDGYRAADIYLRDGSVIEAGQSKFRFHALTVETEIALPDMSGFGPLLGTSTIMRELFGVLERAASTSATVLIEGESGTGKELVAQAIHEASNRAKQPFVVFDCAAVSSNLLESELFGHEKGAFTGAVERRIGRMEQAHGGTLFLDEIGELPLDLQPKLLRALERQEVRRVGGTKTLSFDVRIVAATNRDLAREVNRGAFRGDLYYRLAVIRVQVPPLRERREDIRLLIEHFIRAAFRKDETQAEKTIRGIREETWDRLIAQPWPGNVRELRNFIDRTLALGSNDELDKLREQTSLVRSSVPSDSPLVPELNRPFTEWKSEAVAELERAYLLGQLARHEGNISRAAAASGLDRMYFKRLLRKYR